MTQINLRKDDYTGQQSTEANPPGWLNVLVTPILGATPISVDFSSWKSFRHWVESSDPGCATALPPL